MRWARLLRELGHHVTVAVDYDGHDADAMIALHAWRSAEAIRRFSVDHPERMLAVVLTGTDLYCFQHSHPEPTLASMARADVLVGLHARVADDVPSALRARLQIVYQSAEPPARRLPPLRRRFEIAVVGHLREEKDPLRAALAVRGLPPASRLAVIHLGRAYDERWATAAHAAMAGNDRYRWRGEVPHGEVRRVLARARALVMSSLMEGGANVVAEACVAGLPVIASDIPGNRGMLGDGYPGYYPAGDTDALRACLLRIEREPAFLEALRQACVARAALFRPERERAALAQVLERGGAARRAATARLAS